MRRLAPAIVFVVVACDGPTGTQKLANKKKDAETVADVQEEVVEDVHDVSDLGEDAMDEEVVDDAIAEVVDVEDAIQDGFEPVDCQPGSKACQGLQLATCTSAGDGWFATPCPPNSACREGACQELGRNLIIVFDTSGSMTNEVAGAECEPGLWPLCETAEGPCSRIGVSKKVFTDAVEGLKGTDTSMALFRYPQLHADPNPSCPSGKYLGQPAMTGDPGVESIDGFTGWFADHVTEVLCVPPPSSTDQLDSTRDAILKWMDHLESASDQQPELRGNGGTPLGQTLFYVGEYLRHKVIVDGLTCSNDAACGNPHYRCVDGKCRDDARACRQTSVVVFTDGQAFADQFHGSEAQARRLAYGLACAADDDCSGGAQCKDGICRPDYSGGFRCLSTGTPCLPDADEGELGYCAPLEGQVATCLPDPVEEVPATAQKMAHNALRSPNGEPFGVRLYVVDVSGQPNLELSFRVAMMGHGALFAPTLEDPEALFDTLSFLFDLKTGVVCQ